MSEKRILFFGPYSAPITGQSVAFSMIYDNCQSSEKILIDTTKFHANRVLNFIFVIFKIVLKSLFEKVDTIYFTCSRSNRGFLKDFILLLFFRSSKIKIVNHLHGADFISFYENTFLQPLVNWSYNIIDTHIVLMDRMKEQLSMFPSKSIKVVPNSYKTEFDNIDFINQEKLVVTYFSNIMKSKGILDFLDVAELLLTRFDKLEVCISGLPLKDEFLSKVDIDRVFSKQLKSLIYKFPDRIFYKGFLEGQKKIDLLQNTSVFVLPTYYKSEALPISILEAMRAGCAIVTTNHNYLSSFLDDKNGLLVKPLDPKALFNAIETLCLDDELRENIRRYNFEESQIKYSTTKYVNSIKKIVNFR